MTEPAPSLAKPSPSRDPFERQAEPHRRALKLHCYRMLGGLRDADDLVQETLLRGWRGFDGFKGGSLRGWLIRIATNACLDELDRRKQARRWLPDEIAPDPSNIAGGAASDVAWLEPYPEFELADEAPGPEARYAAREAVRLAFVAAIQALPPRQRAALLLCDVLGWSGAEAAEALDASTASLNSALQRARETLARRYPQGQPSTPSQPTPAEAALLARYVDAWETHDLDLLVAVLKEDAACTMPPWTLWLPDRAAIARFFAQAWAACPGLRLVPVVANGQPAFAAYQRQPDGAFAANALHVLTLEREAIAGMTLFLDPEGRLFEAFGLPANRRE